MKTFKLVKFEQHMYGIQHTHDLNFHVFSLVKRYLKKIILIKAINLNP